MAKATDKSKNTEPEVSEEIHVNDEQLGVYPSWRYHKTHDPVMLHSYEEEKDLGRGWSTTPAAFETKKSEE